MIKLVFGRLKKHDSFKFLCKSVYLSSLSIDGFCNLFEIKKSGVVQTLFNIFDNQNHNQLYFQDICCLIAVLTQDIYCTNGD